LFPYIGELSNCYKCYRSCELWWLIIIVYIWLWFDVKLTPSGLWWTAYLFVWMGWRSLLGECSRIAELPLLFFRIVLDRLWYRMLSFMLFWIYFVEIYPCAEFGYYSCWCIYELMTWLFEVYAIYPLRCFVEIFYACCFGEFIEDVTSISWIFIIFACFITLIEVGRYILHLPLLYQTLLL